MAAAHRVTSFTITQPFLGAPLQFQPALGSLELEELIDAYVVGPASKQDKLSEVTIDFYNRATVDITNGSLVRRYDVIVPSQSPAQSQSSGFSPIYTPSPGSSATFGESRNGSFSMTPPARSRVSKKTAKKDTKKAAEFKLPGFSIMTKDGIDVTSSAGRGTKTKEQREHAHLMRIMKACDECKKKKIRCDPSHKRSHNGSSAASTSTPTTKSSSPARQNYSPASVGPPISREFTAAPSTGDFILFPEDNHSSWNTADASPSEFDSQAYDLSNFDFDLGDIDMDEFTTLNDDNTFDWSFTQQSYPVERDPIYKPVIGDPFNSGLWAGAENLPTPSLSNSGSASLEDFDIPASKPYVSHSQGVTSRERPRDPVLRAPPSPDYFADFPELTFSSGASSLEESFSSISSASSAPSVSWTPGDFSSNQSPQTGSSSPEGAVLAESKLTQGCTKKRLYGQTNSASASSLYEASLGQLSEESSGMQKSQTRLLSTDELQSPGGLRQARADTGFSIQSAEASVTAGPSSAASPNQFTGDSSDGLSPIGVSPLVESHGRFRLRGSGQLLQALPNASSLGPLTQIGDQLLLRTHGDRAQLLTIEHGCSTIANAIHELRFATLNESLSLLSDLRQVRQGLSSLQRCCPRSHNGRRSPLPSVTLTGVSAQLQVLAERVTSMLSSELLTPVQYNRLDPEGRREQRQQQVNTRRRVRSLCATISSLQVLETESSAATSNSRVLTSRHNKQLVVSREAQYLDHMARAVSRPGVPVLPAHDLSVVVDHATAPAPDHGLLESGSNVVKTILSDRSRQIETSQSETAGGIAVRLALLILASLMAASMVNMPAAVLLCVQTVMGVVATCILWPGNSLLASATASLFDPSPTPSVFSKMAASPSSSFLTVAASWLPLSTSSSRGASSSSRRASSKVSSDMESFHIARALRGVSVGLHMV